MLHKNKMDKRIIRTKQYTLEALLKIMETKEYESIQLNEIAEIAGIARQTIYRNYKKKDDILLDHLDEIFYEFLDQKERCANKECDNKFHISIFFQIVTKYKDFFILLHRTNLDTAVLNKFQIYLQEIYTPFEKANSSTKENINALIRNFLSGGIYMLYRSFITDEVHLPTEYYVNLFAELTKTANAISSAEEWDIEEA